MTYPAPQGDGPIGRVHGLALCKAIGERLGTYLDHQQPAQMPPHLTMLMKRLRDYPSGIKPALNS